MKWVRKDGKFFWGRRVKYIFGKMQSKLFVFFKIKLPDISLSDHFVDSIRYNLRYDFTKNEFHLW